MINRCVVCANRAQDTQESVLLNSSLSNHKCCPSFFLYLYQNGNGTMSVRGMQGVNQSRLLRNDNFASQYMNKGDDLWCRLVYLLQGRDNVSRKHLMIE